MDRLTFKTVNGSLQWRFGIEVDEDAILATLAAYEDTGLTPDEIAALRAEVERLTGIVGVHAASARMIHLYLCEFCDDEKPYSEMIADGARKACAEIERLTAELAAMTAERDDARDKLDWLTEAYDRKMRVHDALNRDYVALRKRAGAAERDMAFACGSQPSASSDCSICDICAHKRDDGSCAKQCFMNAMAAMNRWEWRGPVGGGEGEYDDAR